MDDTWFYHTTYTVQSDALNVWNQRIGDFYTTPIREYRITMGKIPLPTRINHYYVVKSRADGRSFFNKEVSDISNVTSQYPPSALQNPSPALETPGA